jgi:hypothetical protein
MQRLMIADGSDVVRKVGKRILSGFDFLVLEASSSLEALVRCEAELPNILIVDSTMDGAIELIVNVRNRRGGPQEDDDGQARRRGRFPAEAVRPQDPDPGLCQPLHRGLNGPITQVTCQRGRSQEQAAFFVPVASKWKWKLHKRKPAGKRRVECLDAGRGVFQALSR